MNKKTLQREQGAEKVLVEHPPDHRRTAHAARGCCAVTPVLTVVIALNG
jgi:hypothetical protein